MRKYILIGFLGFISFSLHAQLYYNEWIDYSKTYYKFKVGKTGLYRINQNVLASSVLANTPAEQFQLWRNGLQVPIYTSVLSGVIPPNGYIEFWGEKNDGKPDKQLYKNPAYQLSDALSLETDTAAYFLTVNATGGNYRLNDAVNDVAGNSLPAESYFMYNYRVDFQQMINRGFPTYFGEYVYSSTYDLGEWWSTADIHPGSPVQVNAGNLYVAPTGPDATFRISVAGNSFLAFFPNNPRTVQVSSNGTNIISQNLNTVDAQVFTNTAVPLSVINNTSLSFSIADIFSNTNDRIVAGFIDLKYPRSFNFGGHLNFQFYLPATATGNYLEISNFNAGTATPVLYDLTNNQRYTANTAVAGLLRFALPPSSLERKMVLVNEDLSNITGVTSLAQKNFINFSNAAEQADYIIISNKILFTGANAVDQYRQYRSSAAGGAFNAKIYDIDDLVDQFAYGIKKHPLSIKNFLRFARHNFAVAPKFAFLIGKAVTYDEYRMKQSSVYADQLNLVPTFGWPASDNLLSSEDLNPVPATPIGRLSAIRPQEVQDYLDKVKLFEQQQANMTQTIANKAWMKTMVHVVGANDASLDAALTAHLNNYRDIISGPSFGAHVYNFNKTSTGPVTPITNALMENLFNDGISLLNYFGHSAATALDYNLNSPDQYNNYGKYPFFIVNGCNAGNIFSYDTSRLSVITSLSENFVLAKNKGAIGFIASTHFGVENYLDAYCQGFYRSLATTGYNKPVTTNMRDGTVYLLSTPTDSVSKYFHAEETVLHGDPALKINAHEKPDFVIEDPQVIINPTFVSVADNNFNIKAYFYNIGMATGDSVSILIRQKYPDGNSTTLFSKRIKSIRYIDSVSLTVPIIATRDKGQNELTITIDDTNQYDELSELNNTVTKIFYIYEDELRTVYPYNFAIVNKNGIKLVASTANPISPVRQYVMELDTTELFNSPLKVTKNVTQGGGIVEFDPGIIFTDSTVYYWRTAPVPSNNEYHWNTSSFVYLPGSSFGFNQSHLYQHLKSAGDKIYIDSFSRKWNYTDVFSALRIINSIYPTSGTEDNEFQVQINGLTVTASACAGHSIIFNVFDPVSLKPLYNQAVPATTVSGPTGGFMGSAADCQGHIGSQYNFEFSYSDTAGRRRMRDFMDWIPSGYLVTARMIYDAAYPVFANVWKNDETIYGTGNTLYQRLINAGFSMIDLFSYPRTWAFAYKKNISLFTPLQKFSQGLYDNIDTIMTIASPDTLGYLTSPVFGPANAWKQVQWRGASADTKPGDAESVDVIGVSAGGMENVLYTLNSSQQNFDISSVNAATYPYLKLRMRNADSINLTPYQLRYWRILYVPVPEGALAPNILYRFKDTLELGEGLDAAIAFKNVSDAAFADSIKVNVTVYDAGNVAHPLIIPRLKKLNPGDTAIISYQVNTTDLAGTNNLFVDVNPDNDQPEQYHFNNFMYKNFAVTKDNYKPLLDVTFDGIHILNNDIVSANPHVLIKLTDEAKFLLLDDTSAVTVQLRYPDGSLKKFSFTSDTLRFTPAVPGSTSNTATVDFTPFLTQDGQYQLIVHGKDKTGNPAGNVDFTVTFQVYNKPMITNMFNYPNPFTTSTAFVFTVTGSQVPQNIRIQILTITGKIVKEITKDELSPLHIGRNITEYKWNGTDMYGQKLANGVYLYRVLTNLNNKSLDKFPTYDANGNEVNTDKFFDKGYGKMYLMR